VIEDAVGGRLRDSEQHRHLPQRLVTRVKFTNVTNGKSLFVCINDHGTLKQMKQEPKCLDLTAGAFRPTRQQPQPRCGPHHRRQ
jgi:rare lipoprotein A